MTEQVSAKNTPDGVSWSEIKDSHKELASHGAYEGEETKGESDKKKESERFLNYHSGSSWAKIQAGLEMPDKQFGEKSKLKKVDHKNFGKHWSELRGSDKPTPSEYVKHRNIPENTEHKPEISEIDESEIKEKNEEILTPFKTKEEDRSFRNNAGNDSGKDIMALRSSDDVNREIFFRENENLYVPPEKNKESGDLEPLRSTDENEITLDEESLILQPFRAVEKQQNGTVENEMKEKEKFVTSVLGNSF